MLRAGRRLAEAGFRTVLYRRPGRPLPPSVDGPWEWPRHERADRIDRRGEAALTVAPMWGVSAAPGRPGRLGRGGPWELEVRDIEAAYGAERTLHVSLEEFARTRSSLEETRERLREGGVPSRLLGERLRAERSAGEVEAFHAAYREFRAFDRPNVLHLFATFRPNARFGAEFPEAVQVGPLRPGRPVSPAHGRRRGGTREWVWYASPASAGAIAPEVVRALRAARPPVRLAIRSPRPLPDLPASGSVRILTDPMPAPRWRRRFGAAELRIVTGSRTLLEAIELGGPFLYFNGVLGSGNRRRGHRPEKIQALLEEARRLGVSRALRRDLADFARGRRITDVVARAARRADGWRKFPTFRTRAFPPPYDEAGDLLVAVARRLARSPGDAPGVVARVRADSQA